MKTVYNILVLLGIIACVSAGSVECTLCKFVVNEAYKYLVTNSSEQGLIDFLDHQVCERMPYITQDCKDVVRQLVPIIIQAFEDKETPDVVCKQVKLCPVQLRYSGAIECTLCKFVVNEAYKYLVTNKSEQGLINFLDHEVCDHIPYYADDCKSIVQDLVPIIFQAFEDKETPEVVCQQIKLCSIQTNDQCTCDVCKEGIQLIEDKIKAGTKVPTVDELVAIIKMSCSLLHLIPDQCSTIINFVKLVYPEIIKFESPAIICTQMKAC